MNDEKCLPIRCEWNHDAFIVTKTIGHESQIIAFTPEEVEYLREQLDRGKDE